MPIVDVEIVARDEGVVPSRAASTLADALGLLFGAPRGHVWARLRYLPVDRYAENGGAIEPEDWPVFVSVLHARLPEVSVLATEAAEIARVVADVVGRLASQVHVQYLPPAAGRIAFGGVLR